MSLRLIVPGLLVTIALTGGCGGERSEARPSVDVTVTRGGGAVVEFPQSVRAWCGPFDEENADVEAVHVMAGKHDLRTRFWRLTAVRSDVEDNPVTTLPNSFVFTEARGAALFAYDNVPGGNELSSAEEESSGRIRVELSGCEPRDTVRLTFDDVELGSELHDLPSLSFDGDVVAVVSDE
jgi:hypothetical protein